MPSGHIYTGSDRLIIANKKKSAILGAFFLDLGLTL